MNTIIILLVEDNPGDVKLIRMALEKSYLRTQLYAVPDVPHALAFLQGDEHSPYYRVRPTMLITDLNLPGRPGHDLLRELQRRPNLADMPVVIFTSSELEEDRMLSQKLQAVEYVRKPMNVDEYFTCVQGMVAFWGTNPCPAKQGRPGKESVTHLAEYRRNIAGAAASQ